MTHASGLTTNPCFHVAIARLDERIHPIPANLAIRLPQISTALCSLTRTTARYIVSQSPSGGQRADLDATYEIFLAKKGTPFVTPFLQHGLSRKISGSLLRRRIYFSR